jgi:hypothetical protein
VDRLVTDVTSSGVILLLADFQKAINTLKACESGGTSRHRPTVNVANNG